MERCTARGAQAPVLANGQEQDPHPILTAVATSAAGKPGERLRCVRVRRRPGRCCRGSGGRSAEMRLVRGVAGFIAGHRLDGRDQRLGHGESGEHGFVADGALDDERRPLRDLEREALLRAEQLHGAADAGRLLRMAHAAVTGAARIGDDGQ